MERNVCIDIAKGIGIILVVLGHLIDYFGAHWQGTYDFIYLFHVPLFFFLSGMFFRDAERIWPMIKKKFKRLFIPFVLANLFFFAVEMIRARIIGEAYDGTIGWRNLPWVFIGGDPIPSMLARPTWFIIVLFRVCIIYKILQLLTKGSRLLLVIICFAICVSGVLFADYCHLMGPALASLPFYCLGHVVKPEFTDNNILFGKWRPFAFACLALPIIFIISQHQRTNVAVNVYGNVFLYFAGAIVGIMAVLWLSKCIERIKVFSPALSYVGRQSLTIMIWHIFAMQVMMKLIEWVTGNAPDSLVCLVIILCTGILAPCLLGAGWSLLKSKVRSDECISK